MIFALRHLSTARNQQGVLQGRQDHSILLDSVDDILVETKVFLQNYDILECYVSPMRRCKETFLQLESDYSPIYESRIIELDFGSYEGLSKTQLIADYPSWEKGFSEDVKLGESKNHFEQRVDSFLSSVAGYLNDEKHHCLVISHGAFIRAMIALHRFGSLNHMNEQNIKNGEIVVI